MTVAARERNPAINPAQGLYDAAAGATVAAAEARFSENEAEMAVRELRTARAAAAGEARAQRERAVRDGGAS